MWTEIGEPMQEKERHNSPGRPNSVLKHSTPRLPELEEFQRCSIVEADPKDEWQTELYGEAGATQETAFPQERCSTHILR